MKHQGFLSESANEGFRGIQKREGGPFGAVIVRKGKILVRAHNTVLKNNDSTCHAEVNAIRKACKILKSPFLDSCTIYSSTEPCPMCFSAIHWARIESVFYGTSIADVERLGFNELTISNVTMKRLAKSRVKLRQMKNRECVSLLKLWNEIPDKKTY
jgi:guanine deaminase